MADVPSVLGQALECAAFKFSTQRKVLTPPPGARPKHQLGRLDKCDWSSTIYPHTSHGIHGYKVIPEVAAYTQSH